MASQMIVAKRLRSRIRAERERRNWSQSTLAEATDLQASTISKIESGFRTVGAAELYAIAKALGVSTDVLLGERGEGDLAWAVSKLTSAAQKIAGEVSALRLRLIDEAADVHHYADDFHAVDVKDATYAAAAALEDARRSLVHLANQFPLPVGGSCATA